MSKTLLVTILLALSINLFGQADSLCIKTVVIPVQFLDVKFTTENVQDEINALFNGINYSKNGATGSVKEYFRDNLGDAANLEFYVTPVVTALLYKEYYGSNSAVERDLGLSTLVLEACDGARRAGIDFYPFDGDEDENIDHIFLIFAGYNESESGNEKDIMPQSGNLSGYNIKYNQKRVATFSCYSEFSGGSEAEFAHIGTICHEFCHRIGLLDMYDVNGETEGEHPGLMQSTSIMDRGNFNNDGKTPPYFSAIERELMGTLEVEDLVVGQHYELFPTRDAGKALRIATANPGEYFLIEYRDNYKWDRYIGGSGLLIYHIDKSENDVGGITAGERWAINAVNCFASHGCATLFDANNGGTITSVFYPEAGNTILSTHTYPITRWDGTGTVTGLTNIAQTTQNSIAFDVVEDLGWHIPYVKECSVTASQHEVMLEWVANHVGPYNWRVEWRSMKSVEPQILFSDKNSIKLTNLTPGEDYTCSIYMQSGEWHSRPYNVSFSTMPELSQFPVIADMKGNFAVGDSVRLYILNLKSTPEYQRWFVNNQPYNEETLTFSAPGTYLIKVEYSLDGSRVDILSKKVVVK